MFGFGFDFKSARIRVMIYRTLTSILYVVCVITSNHNPFYQNVEILEYIEQKTLTRLLIEK